MLEKPKYCGEKWSDLVPMEGGCKCLKCEKILKDFSKKSFSEIAEIQSSESGPHCGIYSKRQIQYWNQETPNSPFSKGKRRITRIAMLSSLLLSMNPIKASQPLALQQPSPQKEVDLSVKKNLPLSREEFPKDSTTTIEGVIIDSLAQEPLVGVTVYIEELEIGAITNEKGEFFIEIENREEGTFPITLQSRYLGYKTKKIKLKNDKDRQLLIKMNPREMDLSVFYIQIPSKSQRFWGKVKNVFRRKNRR